ncbi:hypothetical protein CEXT_791751 [Caerostris extrusa]|uniref:Uncharacterized protein n=1 Tax=Caerostris extrusa TaxID=172846 RepID=A0AAV4V8F6_CAEEX|nr:hypothetical protein CEXT_791751 [Caerostris extrusa]
MVGGTVHFTADFFFHFQLLTSQMESNLFESVEETEKKELEIKKLKKEKKFSTKTMIVIGWLEGGCKNGRETIRRNVDRPIRFPNTDSAKLCFLPPFF